MTDPTRTTKIRNRLEAEFHPTALEVEDDSHHHAGHAGAAGGMGHFSVRIVSAEFAGLSAVARHRRVYAALAELLKTDVHALAIDARAPDDLSR
jgi:BolA protein